MHPFISRAKKIEISPTERFLLHNLEKLYFLEDGEINFFFTEGLKYENSYSIEKLEESIQKEIFLPGHAIGGKMRFLFSVTANEFIFPFPKISAYSHSYVIGIPTKKSVISTFHLKDFISYLEKNEEKGQQISKSLVAWVSDLSQILIASSQDIPPNVYIEAEGSLKVEASKYIEYPKETLSEGHLNLIWIKINEGILQLGSGLNIFFTPSQPPFPLVDGVIFKSVEPTCIQAEGHLKWYLDSFYWDGLFHFNNCILQALSTQHAQSDLEEQMSLALQLESEQVELETIFQNMQGIFQGREAVPARSMHHSQIYQACEVLGQYMRQPFKDINGIPPEDPDAQVYLISKNSFAYQRQVYLGKNWWKKDCGPLLGRFTIDNRTSFAALLPTPPNGYFLVIPEIDKKVKVNAKVAKKIDPVANMFYRYLPNIDKISLSNIIKFGLEQHKKDLLMGLGASLIAILVSLFIPFAYAIVFDYVIPYSDSTLLWQVLIGIGLAALSSIIFITSREVAILRIESYFYHDTECAIWQKILFFPLKFFRKFSAGDLLQRLNGLSDIRKLLSGHLIRIAINVIFSFCYLFAMFFFSPSLALISLCLLFIIFTIFTVVFLKSVKISNTKISSSSILYGKNAQAIIGISKIRIGGAENRIFANWKKQFLAIKKLEIQQGGLNIIVRVISEILPALIFFCIYTTLFFMQSTQFSSISIGYYFAFSAAFSNLFLILIDFNRSIFQAMNCIPIWKRTKMIFEQPVEDDGIPKISVGVLRGDIRLEQVYFRYDEDGPYILENISIHAEPGEFIAIVGHSGSGKSTLTRLLVGFEKPEQGSVFYNGRDLNELDVEEVRSQIGVVLQNSTILQGTIRENITGGRIASDEEVMRAIRLASFENDLSEMAMGLKTVLTGALGLSGGQQQRIILARALLGNPKILILDEATNALDNKTQETIFRNLEHCHITRIVIAHRLSAIKNAHRIYVLHKGKIVQQGTFQELMNQSGIFADFASRQRL